jgi:hypothetical protein
MWQHGNGSGKKENRMKGEKSFLEKMSVLIIK